MVVRADAQQERHARQQQHGGQDFGEDGAAPCEQQGEGVGFFRIIMVVCGVGNGFQAALVCTR